MDFKLMAQAIQNKNFALVDRFTKFEDLTIGDWDKMNEKQRAKYEKTPENENRIKKSDNN